MPTQPNYHAKTTNKKQREKDKNISRLEHTDSDMSPIPSMLEIPISILSLKFNQMIQNLRTKYNYRT